MPLILRLITWLIVFYRRWLSGRGPLRSVRCSFAEHESCSAFGLRATSEAPSARVAIARIFRRIRRCRDACLTSDGHAVSWTPLHDRPPSEIVDELRADGERAATIAQLLEVRRAVAIWRADRVAIDACAALSEPGTADARPRMVSEPAVRERGRRRLAVIAASGVVAAFVLLALPWIGALGLGASMVAGFVSARTTVARERRFALHQSWARRR